MGGGGGGGSGGVLRYWNRGVAFNAILLSQYEGMG